MAALFTVGVRHDARQCGRPLGRRAGGITERATGSAADERPASCELHFDGILIGRLTGNNLLNLDGTVTLAMY